MFENSLDYYSLILSLEKSCYNEKENKYNKEIFSVKQKLLFLIYKNKQISPSNLVKELNIAKSNIALFCKKMILEQYILKKQDILDRRVIFYSLTKKGEKFVEKNLSILNQTLLNYFNQKKMEKINKEIKLLFDDLSKQ